MARIAAREGMNVVMGDVQADALAGVGAGGLIWEHTLADWEWVVGVNLMGVAHSVRVFTPMMLAAARADAAR